MKRWLVPLIFFGTLALLPWLPLGANRGYLLLLGSQIMIFGLAALSLDLILGAGGMVSFGHAAYLIIGAYAVAALDFQGIAAGLVVVPTALATGAVFALITGALALRTRGVNFIMITLAFAQMVYFAAGSFASLGGDDGYSLIERTRILDWPVLGRRWFYGSTWLVLFASWAFCRMLLTSPFGRVLQATRQNPRRVQALGFNPFKVQLIALVIAGMLCTLAGVLAANNAEFVSPAYGAWRRSGDLLIMVILGGAGTLYGALLGAAAVVLLEEGLGRFTEHWQLIFGPMLVVTVIRFRGGLTDIGARR